MPISHQEAAWLHFSLPGLRAGPVGVLRDPYDRSKILTSRPDLRLVWLMTVVGVLTFAGTMVHSYYTYSLAAPMAIVSCRWGSRSSGRGATGPCTRLIGSVVISARAILPVGSWNTATVAPRMAAALSPLVLLAGVLWWMPSAKLEVSNPPARCHFPPYGPGHDQPIHGQHATGRHQSAVRVRLRH